MQILSFIAGIAWVQQWIRLPNAWEWGCLLGLAALLARRRHWHACLLICGAIWAGAYADWLLSDRLAPALAGKDTIVRGYIAGIPKSADNRVGFDFKVTRADPGVPDKLRLNWYYPPGDLKAGQAWELTLRLRRPHGRANPGAFDYEAWLFANHIGATGYVRAKPQPVRFDPPFSVARYLALSRQAIADRLDSLLPGSEQLGVVQALVIGSQDAISQRQWRVFRQTGIVHLMVISGAHISLVAGGVFMIVRRFWARLGFLAVSPQNAAAVSAWLAALCYAALAGFSVPAQRALVMLTVGLLALVWQRNVAIARVLSIALLLVVALDPLALLSVGFCLSFAAVGLLVYVSSGRLGRARYWRRTGQVHVAMAVGLAPLLMVFFQQVSLVAPLANCVAVPIIGLLVVPLSLLAAGAAFLSADLAYCLAWPAERLLHGLWWVLQQMAAWPFSALFTGTPPWYGLLFGVLAVLLLLAPKGMPGRYLSPILLLPLCFAPVEKPSSGEIRFTLLDVGQGLAAVVQTERHALVFDTGAKFSQQADMGESVVLPFLRYRGIAQLDALVISHGDNDHSGGAAAVMAEIPVTAIYSSVPDWASQAGGIYCRAGQHWHWDGVDFDMLSPGTEPFGSENDNSCVLSISNGRFRFLLTGDIQQSAESWLVRRYGSSLASSVLVAPHHGSKTSSSSGFLQQVRPELILIPAGHGNRFGFPHAAVLRRYAAMHIKSFTTGQAGAIDLKTDGATMEPDLMRQHSRRYWTDDAVAK
ncbi:DNA internalization-related competence protein ComEC/Rec2 [Methylomonas sp. SURF-2]|uniref:DNA internalization-related competence protein ComEC/Rec2 n=1 Tax=Methylomonas subterranea TaxID=2952225 RepID=A0ABT1TJB1_9GAMM|nr:DNA internalization-related competence protein ComEC/Rec2 [Methylomonas sp. SURF-2]MCQ8105553.1 DNA internalization-related competence protein ComEC/Rec2 [Methylomonas sp. SURF-2]